VGLVVTFEGSAIEGREGALAEADDFLNRRREGHDFIVLKGRGWIEGKKMKRNAATALYQQAARRYRTYSI
jgi:hypothetical protein